LEIPGISSRKDLSTSIRAALKKRTITSPDYLEYAFQNAVTMDQAQLLQILELLREFDMPALPETCVALSRSRFHHADGILERFSDYSRTYRPQTLGQLPVIFEDLATFPAYNSQRLDSIGVETEVQQIEQHLAESGIVALVDG